MNPTRDIVHSSDPQALRSFWCRGLSIALLQMALASGVTAAPSTAPAVVDPPRAEHHIGKFIFVELATPDLAVAKRFYGGLFGWSLRDKHLDDGTVYTEALFHGRRVAGLTQQRPGRLDLDRQAAWLGFIAVNDVEEASKAALFNGATLLAATHVLPDHDRAAIFADPQGAVFGVLASSTGDSTDALAEPGEWIWRSLLTKDPAAGTAFYQKMFDYEVIELPTEGTRQHVVLATENYARASVNTELPIPAAAPCHWLYYVRVDDLAGSIALAVKLGGKLLLEPSLDPQGGEVAVVTDPLGAPLGLLELPETESRGASR